jgi:hypothetical protein
VVHRGGAVALVAASGGGKTSLALELVLRGLPLLNDDVLVVEPGAPIAAHPGPGLANVRRDGSGLAERLEEAGLGRALGETADETRMAIRRHAAPVPLAAVLYLERPAPAERAPAGERVSGGERPAPGERAAAGEGASGGERAAAVERAEAGERATVERLAAVDPRLLLASTFNLALRDPGRLARQLDVCGAIAESCAIYRVSCPPSVDAPSLAALLHEEVLCGSAS